MYYEDKLNFLEDIFGTKNITLEPDCLVVDNKKYPVIDDVIILSNPDQYTNFVKIKLQTGSITSQISKTENFAEDIQYTFGEEWKEYDKILPEHKKEFSEYFDIIDIVALKNSRVCDLGCGNGRWSYHLKDNCKEIVLVDFSDAIFTARKNLSDSDNCLFFMCDLKKLPFREDFADLIICLGVLHHLPTNCLDEVRNLKKFAPELLIYLYYALDNRPVYFRFILKIVTFLRLSASKIHSPIIRKLFSLAGTFLIYMPLIFLGRLVKPLGLSSYVPLYDGYHDKSVERVQQDVYDRFFTSIEQRVSRKDILGLDDTFESVIVSDDIPYWHFLCKQ